MALVLPKIITMAMSKSSSMAELLQSKEDGQSVEDFCLQHNINKGKYYYWHKRLIDNTSQNKEGFISVKIKNTPSGGSPLAALEFPTGNRLIIYDSCMLPILKTLL